MAALRAAAEEWKKSVWEMWRRDAALMTEKARMAMKMKVENEAGIRARDERGARSIFIVWERQAPRDLRLNCRMLRVSDAVGRC